MLQINRKFLEEQVRIALKEEGVITEEEGKDWLPIIGEMLQAVFVGSSSSWKTVIDTASRYGMYGTGISGIYAKVIEEEKLDKVLITIFKLLEPKLTEGGTLTAEFKREPFDDFVNAINNHKDKLSSANSDKEVSSLLLAYYEDIDDIVNKHGLGNMSSGQKFDRYIFRFWAGRHDIDRTHYNPGTNKRWIKQETEAVRKLKGDPESVGDRLEAGILWCLSVAPAVTSFMGLGSYLATDNGKKLTSALAAAAAAKYHEEQPVFSSLADISLSLLGTVGMVFTLGGSKFITGGMAAGLKAVTMEGAATKLVAAGAAMKASKFASVIATKTYIISEIGLTFANMLDAMTETFGPNAQKYSKYSKVYFDVMKNSRYLKSLGNPLDDDWDFDDAAVSIYQGLIGGGQSEEEMKAEGFVQLQPDQAKQLANSILTNKMVPLLDKLSDAFYGQYGEAMQKAGLEVPQVSKLQNTGFQKSKIIKMLKNGDEQGHAEFLQGITTFEQSLKEHAATLKSRTNEFNKTAALAKEKAQVTDSIASNPKIKLPDSVTSRTKSVTTQDSEDEDSDVPQVNSTDLFFVGDSIAQGMRDTATGSDGVTHGGRTSDYVLKQLINKFGEVATLEEGSGNKTAVVSVGTNDAVNHSVGNKRYTPEKTARNIEQIVNLLKQNGYNTVKVMPLMQDGNKDRKHYTYNKKKLPFDKEAHASYVSSVNSSLQTAGLELFDNNVELWPDGIHPKSPKNLLSKALGAKVSQSTSSSMVASQGIGLNKGEDKPKEEFDGDVDKINAFFNRPVKEMKGISRSKREAAVRKYYQIIGASGRTGLPLEALVKHIGAESSYINKGFLGDTKIKNGPSYGLGQILRTTGEWLSGQPGHPQIPSGQSQVDFLNIASNNLDMTIKQLEWNRNYLDRKDWFKKSDPTQKNLFLLYSYNMGPGGPGKYIKRAGGNIELALNNLSNHYVKRYGWPMGYGHKIMTGAGKSVPTVNFDDVSVSSSSAGGVEQLPGQSARQSEPEEKKDLIGPLKDINNLSDFAEYFYELFRNSASRADAASRKMDVALGKFENSNLGEFRKRNVDYIKVIHKTKRAIWKSEFERDMKDAAGDPAKEELANKKIAFYHRPIFYADVFSISIPNIKENSVSFAFEPGTKRVSVNFGGDNTFYRQDSDGGKNFAKFLSILEELKELCDALAAKLKGFLKSEPEEERNINAYLPSMEKLSQTISQALPVLKDGTEPAIRKAHVITILDLAFQSFA